MDSGGCWSGLSRALAVRGRARLGALLDLALEASGAERAFLVRGAPRGGHGTADCTVLARRSLRADGDSRPSRTALRQALAAPVPSLWLEPGADRRLAAGRSVRSLGLRSILAVPVPAATRTALLLDSRGSPRLRPEELEALLAALAALVGLALAAEPEDATVRPPDRPAPRGAPHGPGLAGRSPAFRRMMRSIDRIAPATLPVLVQGETGAGKEAVCIELHRRSRRCGGPFVALCCTALPESLLEAELFGAVRGAYTGSETDRPGLFRLAHGGTLFLDEVGDMPLAMQAKLLRVLQEGRVRPVGGAAETTVDVRLVAATHRQLEREVRRGAFRADLYYRMAVLELRVPALRERREDLPSIVESLASRLVRETGHGPLVLEPCAWRALAARSWPGNVRELHAVLARALLRAEGRPLTASLLEPDAATPAPVRDSGGATLERQMVESALHAASGSVTRAAARIGWSRQKLYRRMRALGLGAESAAAQSGSTTSSDSSTFQ